MSYRSLGSSIWNNSCCYMEYVCSNELSAYCCYFYCYLEIFWGYESNHFSHQYYYGTYSSDDPYSSNDLYRCFDPYPGYDPSDS
jgi:hypothetical protein